MSATTTAGGARAERGSRLRHLVHRTAGRSRRPAKIVVLAIAAIYALYLVAANLLLATGLLGRLLTTKDGEMAVSYGSAFSLLPGRVVTRGFSLRFQDSSAQMALSFERATIDVDLFALLRRTFHVRRLRATETAFALRLKMDTAAGNERRLEAYPKIVGFSDPPLRTEPPRPARAEEDYDHWTVELEDIDASVHELWIMEYRYRGHGEVTGGFRLRPLRELWVDPSAFEASSGVLSIGDDDVLQVESGRLEARVDAFDVRVPSGAAVLRHVSARGGLRGAVTSLTPFGRMYLPQGAPELADGRGRAEINVHVDHGVVTPETRIDYETEHVQLRAPSFTLDGSLSIVVQGESAAGEEPRLRTSAHVETAALKLDSEAKAAIHVKDADASFTTDHSDLAATMAMHSASARVSSARAPDLRAMTPILPTDVSLSGSAGAAARFEARRDGADGRLDLALEDVRLRTSSFDVSASGSAWVNAAGADPRQAVAASGSGANLTAVRVAIDQKHVEGLDVAFRVPEGTLRLRPLPSLRAQTTLEVAPGDRAMHLVAALASLPKWVGEAAAKGPVRARAILRAGPSGVDFSRGHADNGRLTGQGGFRKNHNEARGAFLVRGGPLSAGVVVDDGRSTLVPFANEEWLSTHVP